MKEEMKRKDEWIYDEWMRIVSMIVGMVFTKNKVDCYRYEWDDQEEQRSNYKKNKD